MKSRQGHAPIRLDFIEPGGATTGRLLPAGGVRTRLDIPGETGLEISAVDAANACVFAKASSLGLLGTELPDALESDVGVMRRLSAIRSHAAVAMGLAASAEEAARNPAVPFIALVAPPAESFHLDGERRSSHEMDLSVRVLSNGRIHRALPLTISLCTAVAAAIQGTVVHDVVHLAGRRPQEGEALRLGMPSGVLSVGAHVERDGCGWRARHGSFYRTARLLFDGYVHY
ncbi:2-methylaconitate cis-trans isomerase PrpF family protein [Xenophilus azovorans]|uniref:2-methylaconitate cis-trans isomerase PrpF family protein n=1 Tax=Xenophilus azovorans TaxID=151755 RepID=UPI001FE132DC|nr:2-methylaconitate cis-trans isomerase PrpF family protein [Xenophilus azovorans]